MSFETEGKNEGTVVRFAQRDKQVHIPADATEVRFTQRNHGGFQLDYTQVEKRDSGKVVLIAEQTRKILTTIYYSVEGDILARCVATGEWEVQKPGIDPAKFSQHLSVARR